MLLVNMQHKLLTISPILISDCLHNRENVTNYTLDCIEVKYNVLDYRIPPKKVYVIKAQQVGTSYYADDVPEDDSPDEGRCIRKDAFLCNQISFQREQMDVAVLWIRFS